MSSNAFGTVVLSSRFRPLHAVGVLATGGLFLLLGLDGLLLNVLVPRDEGSMARGALFVVLAIGVAASALGVLQLVRPQVFVEATEQGLVLCRQPGAPPGERRAPGRFLVPWRRIRSLDYEVHALPTGLRKAKTETIAVRFETDEAFRVPAGFSHLLKALEGSDPEAVYIDAGSGTPGGRELLRRLEELRAEYAADG